MKKMSYIYKLLQDNDEIKIIKRGSFFNLLASFLNAMMSAILLFLITRVNGIAAGGMFSIASAIAYQCYTVGEFGVRNYQSSDVKKDYSFFDYVNARIITCAFMIIMLIYLSFFQKYSLYKALLILSFGLNKGLDAAEDVVHGEYQRNGRLDISAILLSLRYILTLLVFILVLILSSNSVIALSLSTIVSIIISIMLNMNIIRYFIKDKWNFDFRKIRQLLLHCLPLCISGFISIYVINAPKYGIDKILSNSDQAIFAVLFIPVVVINIMSTAVYRPYITKLSFFWKENNTKKFLNLIFLQIGVVIVLTMVVILGGYILGLNILELIYGIELIEYMKEFLILLLGGGINTVSVFLSIILTIQRQQDKTFIGYIFSLVFVLLASNVLIQNYEILGATLLYVFTGIILVLVFTIFIWIKLKKCGGYK